MEGVIATKRNSAIELLRIFAMFMIVMAHLSAHGVLQVTSGDTYEIWMRGGVQLNKVFSILLIPGGRVGVALFFMITGYFQISKSSISIKKVVIKTFFYSVLIQIVALILHIGSFGNLVRSIAPLSSNSWWYVTSYVVLMACSPTINGYFLKLDKKQKRVLIAIVWLLIYTIPYLLNMPYYSLERGILFYLIGAYLRTEESIGKIRLLKPLLGTVFILSWSAYVPIGYLYYSGYCNNKLFSAICDGMIFNGMIIVSCSTALFLIFIQIKEFSNTFINTIAQGTFGVYLLHDNMYRFCLWDNCFHVSLMFQSSIFPIFALGVGILIFCVCFFVDYARERFFGYAEHLKKLSKP